MTLKPEFASLAPAARALRAFGGDRRGNVAMIFGLALLPLVLGAGTAVDLRRQLGVKVDMQDAADAAVLAAARAYYGPGAPGQRMKAAEAAVASYMQPFKGRPDVERVDWSLKLEGDEFVLRASGEVPTTFAAMAGKESMGLDVTSAASTAGSGELEIALVLDNTGSMTEHNGEKLKQLKIAAKLFIDKMEATAESAGGDEPVRIAVVPFSNTVNVGGSHRGAAWLDPWGKSLDSGQDIFNTPANRFDLFDKMDIAWGGCVETRQAPYDVQETAPDPANPETLFLPYFAPDEPQYGGAYNAYLGTVAYEFENGKKKKKKGSVTDAEWRTLQGDVAKYDVELGWSGARGPNKDCGIQPVTPLTTDFSDLKDGIDDMVADGTTNIPIGLAWGWHVLSPVSPLGKGSAKPYGAKGNTKVVVLMTDGENYNWVQGNPNRSRYTGVGYMWQERVGVDETSSFDQRTKALDGRLALLCANMKAKGIRLYTLRVEMDGNSSGVLETCAVDDGFYEVKDAKNMSAAFDDIAGKLTKLRLSR